MTQQQAAGWDEYFHVGTIDSSQDSTLRQLEAPDQPAPRRGKYGGAEQIRPGLVIEKYPSYHPFVLPKAEKGCLPHFNTSPMSPSHQIGWPWGVNHVLVAYTQSSGTLIRV